MIFNTEFCVHTSMSNVWVQISISYYWIQHKLVGGKLISRESAISVQII